MGIPQGSPLSSILYLFYNADLVETCRRSLYNVSVIAFVDDTNIVVYGDSGKGNCQRLRAIYRHCGRWTETHGSEFNVSKYQMIHLSRNRKGEKDTLRLGETEVKPSARLKLLGVYLDRKMTGNTHLRALQDKVPALVATLKTLTKSTWGASLAASRQLYCQAVRPVLTYATVAWFLPAGVRRPKKGVVAKLQTIQGQCLRVVAGAYKATSTEALEAELGVEPLDLYTGRRAAAAAARHALSEARKGIVARTEAILHRRLPGRRCRRDPHYRSNLSQLISLVGVQTNTTLSRPEGGREKRREVALGKVATVKKALKGATTKLWKKRWKEGAKGAQSCELQPDLCKKVPLIHKGLRKPQSALII